MENGLDGFIKNELAHNNAIIYKIIIKGKYKAKLLSKNFLTKIKIKKHFKFYKLQYNSIYKG